jgi:hypothetical protein
MDVYENHKGRRYRGLHERMLEAVGMKKRRGHLKETVVTGGSKI